jgi:hypothetical protein
MFVFAKHVKKHVTQDQKRHDTRHNICVNRTQDIQQHFVSVHINTLGIFQKMSRVVHDTQVDLVGDSLTTMNLLTGEIRVHPLRFEELGITDLQMEIQSGSFTYTSGEETAVTRNGSIVHIFGYKDGLRYATNVAIASTPSFL